MINDVTRSTTESTLLQDIATAIKTQRSDDRIYHVPPIRAARGRALCPSSTGGSWDPALSVHAG